PRHRLARTLRPMLDVRAPARSTTARALTVWGGLVASAVIWGRLLVLTGARLDGASPPFWSRFEPHPGPGVLPATAVAAILAWKGPTVARTLAWRPLLVTTAAATACWAIALAYVDGAHALTDPLTLRRNDYLQTAHDIGSLHVFLAHFVGVSAWAITMIVLASGRADPRADLWALAGGLLFGITAFLSYGLVLLALIPTVVCLVRRRARPLLVAALGAAPVFAVFAAM